MRILAGSFILWTTAVTLSAQQFPSAAGRQQDLDFIAKQLPALHLNFFFRLDRTVFQQAVSDLAAKLNTASDAEFYVGLAKLAAMAGDPHTSINLTGAPVRTFPLRLRWFEDGVFVTRATAPYSAALGAKLVRIGDTPVETAILQVGTVFAYDNDAWLRDQAPSFLINQITLQGLGILPPGDTASLTFRTLLGRGFTLQLDTSGGTLIAAVPEDQGPIPLDQQNAFSNYWYIYSAANRMLYFRYNACQDNPANPFGMFALELLKTLDNNPVDTFVFDVRGNSGGASALVSPLFNGLADRFVRLTANPQFRIYDVFNSGTFSSGLANAEDLLLPYPSSIPNPNTKVNLSTRVVSIGEPTGGKPSGYGNVTRFQLPASGFSGQYSTRYFNAPAGIPDRPSLDPAILVKLRSTDYFARFDPVMAVILGRGTGSPAPPSGDVITVNGASFRTDQGIAPGSYATAFGNFTTPPNEIIVGGENSKTAGGTTSQQNFIVPPSAVPGTANVMFRADGKQVAAGTVTISRSGPGIFVMQPADPSQPGAVLNQDGSLNTAANPAASGSIVQIFATGYGGQSTQVYFNEQPAELLFSGAHPLFPGLWQVNARIPSGLTGQVPLFLFSGTLASNGVTIQVR